MPDQDPILSRLYEEPWLFEFTQAMRILLRNSGHGDTLVAEDRRYDAPNEPVRIGANQSLSFPPSDIHGLTPPSPDTDNRAKMLINFLGLTGPSGVLPQVYTEFMMRESPPAHGAPADFFDIFNHRFAMLFYFAWEKFRFAVARERRPDDDFFRQILLSLSGLGTEFLQRRQFTPDDVFAKYAGLLSIEPRSACALQDILADDLKVPVEVMQFAGNWYVLDPASVTEFRNGDDESVRLGYGVVLSEEYWSQEFMVRLRIGPLDLRNFRRFLPGGSGLKRITEICRFFSRDELVFEVQLILRRDEVPGTILSGDSDAAESQLGWTTWAVPTSADHTGESLQSRAADVDDVVIRLSS